MEDPLQEIDDAIDDADALTMMLKEEGFDNVSFPGGIHLARSLIDRLLAEKEKEHPQQRNSVFSADGNATLELRSKPNDEETGESMDMDTQTADGNRSADMLSNNSAEQVTKAAAMTTEEGVSEKS